MGSCSGTSVQYTGGAVTDFKSFRIKVSTGILRDGPALTCNGNVSNPLDTCGFTLFQQLLDLMGAERVFQVKSGDV